jgi:hypothetical protein
MFSYVDHIAGTGEELLNQGEKKGYILPYFLIQPPKILLCIVNSYDKCAAAMLMLYACLSFTSLNFLNIDTGMGSCIWFPSILDKRAVPLLIFMQIPNCSETR